jgi:putative Holliday junction resolvase
MVKVSALGLDIGKKRIGVAGCDGTGLIATGLTTIWRATFNEDLLAFGDLVQRREARVLVVGLPYCLDGSLGYQAERVQKYAQKLGKALELPIDYIDERLTSVEAAAQLKAQKRFSTYNKALVDQQAATIILQQWLDLRRSNRSLSLDEEEKF